MMQSKKNLFFILFLTVLVLSYALMILPNEETTETFSPDEVNKELEEIAIQQEDREERGATGIIQFTGMPYYAYNDYYYQLHNRMVHSYKNENFTRFVHLRLQDLIRNEDSFLDEHQELFIDSPIPRKDTMHLYHQTLLTYQGYLDQEIAVTGPMIEEKTFLQSVKNILLSSVTYLIIFMAIYFSSDLLTRDKQNQTLLQGLPVPWYQTLNTKSIAAFVYSLLILTGLTLLGLTIITIQFGFGSLDIKVPTMIAQKTFRLEDYDYMLITEFLFKVLSFIPLIMLLFIRLNMILSLIFRNLWLVLTISTILLVSEFIYFTRTKRQLFGFDVSHFPQTYFDFGKVVTGDKNFLLTVESITYEKGILVLLITLIVVECLVLITAKFINRRRFFSA